jgi:hypothetical protein
MATKQADDAIVRYHKSIENSSQGLDWAEELQQKMQGQGLFVAGKSVSPFLRPHFLSRKQFDQMSKASEALYSALQRVNSLALTQPSLMDRIGLLPAEKMLASVNPGYNSYAVTSLMDAHINNGSLRVGQYSAEIPIGLAYSEILSDLLMATPPMKEFRKKYTVQKTSSVKALVSATLKAWKEFGGKTKTPGIAVLELKQPFHTAESNEFPLLVRIFQEAGLEARVVNPAQLEFRNGALLSEGFRVDVLFRNIPLQEFLLRFDLNHPLLRAYQNSAVCMVNSFRSELGRKQALLSLLTDEEVTRRFPAVEKKAIREFVPTTRMVGESNVVWNGKKVDLPSWILRNRSKLVLRPNEENPDQPVFRGSELDDAAWERALKVASGRTPYVVQENIDPITAPFPVYQWGTCAIRQMNIEVHPHAFLGKVSGCSSWLTPAAGSFTTAEGVLPVFVLSAK